MEKTIANIFKSNDIKFKEQIRHTDFSEIKGLGADIKQFDFAIKTKEITYLIEVNYYNSGGSKLNETARAYADIAPKINQNPGFKFVWITDGQGWLTAKNKLEEAYSKIPHVYNLTSIAEFITLLKS